MSAQQILDNSMAGKVHDIPAPPPFVVVVEVVNVEYRTPIRLDLNSAQDQFELLNILKHNLNTGRRVEVRR